MEVCYLGQLTVVQRSVCRLVKRRSTDQKNVLTRPAQQPTQHAYILIRSFVSRTIQQRDPERDQGISGPGRPSDHDRSCKGGAGGFSQVKRGQVTACHAARLRRRYPARVLEA